MCYVIFDNTYTSIKLVLCIVFYNKLLQKTIILCIIIYYSIKIFIHVRDTYKLIIYSKNENHSYCFNEIAI